MPDADDDYVVVLAAGVEALDGLAEDRRQGANGDHRRPDRGEPASHLQRGRDLFDGHLVEHEQPQGVVRIVPSRGAGPHRVLIADEAEHHADRHEDKRQHDRSRARGPWRRRQGVTRALHA